ncbi:MAG: hypothetical protein ACTSSG_00725 [Candidatus Heimdallarchaeaceae archaeon]
MFLIKKRANKSSILLILLNIFFILLLFQNGEISALSSNGDYQNSSINNNSIGISITGNTAQVSEPRLICTEQNRVFILWKESEISFNQSYGVYDFNDTVFLQELNFDGTLKGEPKVVYNDGDMPYEVKGTADVEVIADTTGNLYFFWYVLETTKDNGGSTKQYYHLFFKKLDSNLNTVIDTTNIFTRSCSGISSSPFKSRYIKALVFDNYQRIHLLFNDVYYFYLTSDGALIDYFAIPELTLGDVDIQDASSLIIDGNNNTYIVGEISYDYIYFTKFQIISDQIVNVTTTELTYNDTCLLVQPEIYLIGGKFYVSWLENLQGIVAYYIEITSSGEVVENVNLSLREGFLSKNESLVYSFKVYGVDYKLEDAQIHYGVFTYNNTVKVEEREILRIFANPANVYGPSLFGLQCIEDLFGDLWVTWYVNDGQNGFQVFYWKLKTDGSYLFPVIEIAPEYHIYTFCIISELTKNPLIFLSIISFLLISYFYKYQRRKKML